MKFLFLCFGFILFASIVWAQHIRVGDAKATATGRFYGKITDASTNKPVEFAPIQLFQIKHDSISGSSNSVFIGGQLTEGNGDFSLENLQVGEEFLIKVSAIGYESIEHRISFDIKPGQEEMGIVEKDLGNIKLEIFTQQLNEVVIDGSDPSYKLEIDKKVYNVSKNPITAGGTGEDVLKNVPSVNVDMDGNVTMRNAAPQIFVDGRPTTLTLEQIPADAIESIEVISNPSAKYDASGGMGGIINIVLKKNRKIGYNGSVRGGVDMRGRLNGGGDMNAREKKINFFVSGSYSQRRNIGMGITERNNYGILPQTNVFQNTTSETNGFFTHGKAGLDYHIDNRNTLTLSQSYHKGSFNPVDEIDIQTDTLLVSGIKSAFSSRLSDIQREFYNTTGSLLYKRLFPKAGRELTADVSYNSGRNQNRGNFETQNYNFDNDPVGEEIFQQQKGNGGNDIFTAQADWINPVNDKMKIETGTRAMLRKYSSINENFSYNNSTGLYEKLNNASSNYLFDDRIYAAYITFSNSFKKLGYQAGLRIESSDYSGKLVETNSTFNNHYPLSLFPSAFISYKLNENSDFQLNYTRRINRPGFMQLIPFTDYSDSLNLSRGNPALKPEFTNSTEFSYQRIFNRQNSFLASVYLKNSVDVITRYQTLEYDSFLGKEVIVNSYQNANSSYAYGIELTSKNAVKSWLDITANLNLYNSVINGDNLEKGLGNELFSWFSKLNVSFKLPKDFSVQLTGDYFSKTAVPIGGDSRRSSTSMSWFGSTPSTIQGYTNPNYGVEIAVKKEFLKEKAASVTLSVSDVFKTKRNDVYAISDYFTQHTLRIRDQQLFKLNFNYRFGKMDASLFKRKNSKSSMDGIDMGM